MQIKMNAIKKMNNNELANYYLDVCAYRDEDALERQNECKQEIINRFTDKYADKCEDLPAEYEE